MLKKIMKNEYFVASIFFMLFVLAFLYRIFLGEVYSPVNMIYHFPPWNSGFVTEGTRGALLSDPIGAFYPTIHVIRNSVINLEPALWYPYSGLGGWPISFETIGFLLVPTRWVFLVFPLTISPTISIFLRMLLTMLGMYVLLRGFDMHRVAATIGAVVFNFAMPMIVWLNWPHTEVAMFAPWFMWAVYMMYKGRRGFTIVSAIFMHWMLMLGMPAYAIYFYYITSFFFLYLLILDIWKNGSLALNVLVKKSLQYGWMLFLGTTLSLPYILPFLEGAFFVGRTMERMTTLFRTSIWRANNILHLFDAHYHSHVSFGIHYNEIANFVGVATLLLVFLAIFIIIYKRDLLFLFFSVSAVILFGMLFALPVLRWFAVLPLISSSPISRVVIVFAFVCAVLAAKGIDYLFVDLPKSVVLQGLSFSIISLYTLFIAGLYGVSNSNNQLIWTQGLVFAAMIVIVASCFVLLIISTNGSLRKVFCSQLLLLFVVDMFYAGIHYNPSVVFDKSDPAIETEIAKFLNNSLGYNRHVSTGGWTFISNNSAFYNIYDLRGHSLFNPAPRTQRFLRAVDASVFQHSPTRSVFTELTDNSNYLLSISSVHYILKDSMPHESTLRARLNESDSYGRMPLGEIVAGSELRQPFISALPNLAGISIAFATYTHVFTAGELKYSVIDEYGNIIRSGNISHTNLSDNAPYTIYFDPIEDSENKNYTLVLYAESGETGNVPTVWMSMYSGNEMDLAI